MAPFLVVSASRFLRLYAYFRP